MYLCNHTNDRVHRQHILVCGWRLTLEVLVTTIDALGTLLNRIITAQWEGMGDVGSARYEPVLPPPCPTIRGFELQ